MRATIWQNCAQRILPQFEQETGMSLKAGMKIMVYITVNYHELYGLSGNITAINSDFSLGDIERQRRETIMRLEQEGVIDMNKTLELPTVMRRVAVVSAETAAGYGDFCKQLENNVYGFNVTYKLYPAQVQGVGADESIINALESVLESEELPDVVVIIRGGGSRSDLACFDSYELAFHIANFPLPILTGIGHERDNSVSDIVAHTRLKTPTAVAEFIIAHNAEFLSYIEMLNEKICSLVRNYYEVRHNKLDVLHASLRTMISGVVRSHADNLDKLRNTLSLVSSNVITQLTMHLANTVELIKAFDPRDLLKKGYSITTYNGKKINSVSQVKSGDHIETHLSDGVLVSTVE
jgi:exodeoxyribonuclease VII large subunit